MMLGVSSVTGNPSRNGGQRALLPESYSSWGEATLSIVAAYSP